MAFTSDGPLFEASRLLEEECGIQINRLPVIRY